MGKLSTVMMRTVPCLPAEEHTTNTKIGQTLHAQDLRTSSAQDQFVHKVNFVGFTLILSTHKRIY